jgi:hypothetical protein
MIQTSPSSSRPAKLTPSEWGAIISSLAFLALWLGISLV